MYITIEDLVLPNVETLHLKATLYVRNSATEVIKFETEAREMVDLIAIGTQTSTTKTLTATNDYFGKTAEYYANTPWPATQSPDIIMV